MESEILSLLAAGRPREAFELLLRAYQDKAVRLAYSVVHDEAIAHDAAQEAFLRIWKGLPGYRGDSALGTWIFAIVRNTAITARKRALAGAASSIHQPETQRAVDRLTAERERPDRTPDLMRLVAHLPEHYRQVIMLYYIEERSYENVARLLDMPLGTVKTYLHRARKELAQALIAMERSEDAVPRV